MPVLQSYSSLLLHQLIPDAYYTQGNNTSSLETFEDQNDYLLG